MSYPVSYLHHFTHLPLKKRSFYRSIILACLVFLLTLLVIYRSYSSNFFLSLAPFITVSSFRRSSPHPRASEAEHLLRDNPIYKRWSAKNIRTWDQYTLRGEFRKLNASDLPLHPPPATNDVCLLIGRDPNAWHLWRRNSRSVCVTSPICIPTNEDYQMMHTSTFTDTECRVVTPAFGAFPAPFDNPHRHEPDFWPCSDAQHRLELCPWPNITKALPTPCIPKKRVSAYTYAHTNRLASIHNSVLKGITIVVPRYPFAANIFHYAATIAGVAHAVTNIRTIVEHYGTHRLNPPDALESLPINVLFLNQRYDNLPWQTSLDTILFNGRMDSVVPNGVDIFYMTELAGTHICVDNPVVLGQRGHVNVWPFPNSSDVSLHGTAVPKDAIDFRADVYAALNIKPHPIVTADHAHSFIPPPPLVVGYAKRPGREAETGKGVHAAGTVRRFSEEDERWFTDMLRNETKAENVQLREFLTTPDEKFSEQVIKIEKIGFVVGIHGANLANCIFMRPLGALLEIFPANMYSSCYIAGSNSGLAYFVHDAHLEASPQESGCSKEEKRCWKLTRQRMVKIGTPEDRLEIRNNVRAGIAHIVRLNRDYPDGVPVRYNRVTSTFHMMEDSAVSST